MNENCKIAQLGHPVLRQHAHTVENINAENIIQLVESMLHTLSESKGVGLAAPQIFESIRLLIVASRPSIRYPEAPEMEPVVMFNPEYEVLSDEMISDWEGCLSIPGIRALVPRYEKIKITYSDQQGVKNELIATGFIARVFQHEYDHLNGLVYLDRVINNKDIISESEFQKRMEQD